MLRNVGPIVLSLSLALSACGDDSQGPALDTAAPLDTGPDVTPSESSLVLDPPAIDFGGWPQGASEIRDLELENAGNEPLRVLAISLDKDDGYYSFNRQSFELAPRERGLLKVSFFALDNGVHENTLRLVTNAKNGPNFEVPLVAVGGRLKSHSTKKIRVNPLPSRPHPRPLS